jgi:hypothetical protein
MDAGRALIPDSTPEFRVIGAILNSLPAGPGVHSVAAFRGNNHVFVPVASPNAESPTDACNAIFGLPAKQGNLSLLFRFMDKPRRDSSARSVPRNDNVLRFTANGQEIT